MRSTKVFRGAALPAALISAIACSSGSPNEPGTPTPTEPGGSVPSTGGKPDEGIFQSAHPSGAANVRGSAGPGTVSGGDVGGVPGATPSPTTTTGPAAPLPNAPESPPAEPDEGGVERAIEEADVIKREGDRLYALSAIGGLTVADIADPDALKLLGRYRTTATPFEMYVREETVFVLYNGYGQYDYSEQTDSYTFYQTSYVIALDVSNPEAIAESQRFEIPGYIADSRLVGDALYVVAYDDSYCYRCGDEPQTHVMSLNVSDPSEILQVDEIDFDERQDGYGWGRSLSGNDQRLYVAGPRYGNGVQPEGSVIQVIDIADGSGDMKEGAALEVAGQINSRWQMDEHEGVLRVVSQPLSWAVETVPSVETFRIESSNELNPLGKVELTLPEAETLQAVRFDGDRGYAITFRQTDPLFTLDLSDPANPVQAGELQMPGWVYHMEPRGDRLIGLGFDQGNAEGGLTVSLFDVSDLGAPTMIDRVNFGGAWANLAEDQNRIHKSFQVLDADELVLVPFAGYDYTTVDDCRGYGKYVSGVQLVNWSEDELSLAGVAPSSGQARRAFLHKDRLLTMSDERLEAFDIEDRQAPKSTSKVDLAQIVNQLEVAGDAVVRVGSSYWSSGRGLEVTVSTLDELVALEPGTTVAFDDINAYDCNGESYLRSIDTGGDNVYFLYDSYRYNRDNGDVSKESGTRVKVLDVSDPAEPKVAGDASLGFSPQTGYGYVPGMVNNGLASVALGSSMVFTNHQIEYNDRGFIVRNESTLEVVDFSDPNEPKRTSVQMPSSLGSTGLLVSDDVIATSHFEAVPENVDAVRFFLDRVDLSDPSAPKVLPPLNVPGSLLAYDAEHQTALTVDYQYVNFENISPKQCYEEEFGNFITSDPSRLDYENARGPCTALRFELELVDVSGDKAKVLDSHAVDKGVSVSTAALGDDRVFIGTGSRYPASPPVGTAVPVIPGAIGGGYIGYGYYPVSVGSAKVLVVSGLGKGELTVASVEVETTSSFYGFSSLLARGKKAVVAAGWQSRLSVIDAADAAKPVVAAPLELAGGVTDMDLVGDTAVIALGTAGVQTVSLAAEK